MPPVLGTMMPEICEAPHLSTRSFHPSFSSAFNKVWDAFITFPKLPINCGQCAYPVMIMILQNIFFTMCTLNVTHKTM